MDTDDIDQRLKYAGIFHRRKRTPGRFMMRCVPGLRDNHVTSMSLIHEPFITPRQIYRMRIPNGLLTADQLFFMAEAMAKYGDDYEAVVDITTRQNLQLRGLKVSQSTRSDGQLIMQHGID